MENRGTGMVGVLCHHGLVCLDGGDKNWIKSCGAAYFTFSIIANAVNSSVIKVLIYLARLAPIIASTF